MFNITTPDKLATLHRIAENILENLKGNRIEMADLDALTFKRGDLTGGYRYGGEKPFGTVERLADTGWVAILSNVSFLRFVYYDKSGNLIIDEDAKNDPSKISRIKVNAMIHNGEESSKHFISDGYRGIDLDGDKSNGVAKLKEVKFLVDVN